MVRRLLHDHKDDLLRRNPDWIVADLDEHGFDDAKITRPLVTALEQDEWQAPLIEFVRNAVGDLKETGILEALVSMGAIEHQVEHLDQSEVSIG